MKEIKDITRAYDEAVKQGKKAVLATVVHVEGSSYRRPGARMLVTEDGMLTGAISGGCLEGDALRKALLVMSENKTRLVTYDTNDEDDAKLGMGLGCNGIIQVLIEPIDEKNNNHPIHLLKKVIEKRGSSVVVTLFSMEDRKKQQAGTCLLLNENGITGDTTFFVKETLIADANTALVEQNSVFKNYISGSNNFVAFIEFIKPVVSLVIAGAGNDVMPLVNMAGILGWETTVIDGRANYAKQERFPSCQVMLVKPKELFEKINVDEMTVFTLMTHNYNYDLAMLKELVQRKVTYIGILGPRKKRDRMVSELNESGLTLSEDQLSSIHAPVGLDIGAETAEEIALSIVAEIKAVVSGKKAQPLKNSSETIHSRTSNRIEEVRIASQNIEAND